MNKVNLRQIVELVGIVSIVLSLLFVGIEIQQNTNVATNQAYNDFGSRYQELTLSIAHDEELSSLIARIQEGETSSDFSPDELVRIIMIQTSAIRLWEGLFRSVESGLLPPGMYRNVGGGQILDNDFFRARWDRYKDQFAEDFIEFFEQQAWNQ